MKYLLTISLIVLTTVLSAQTIQLENLNEFDKLVVDGEVGEILVRPGFGHHHEVIIKGLRKEELTSKVEAGVLYLTLKKEAHEIVINNPNLRRIETTGPVALSGAEYVGENGKYLITGHTLPVPMAHLDFDLPKIDIDLPDVDFDFPEIDLNLERDFDFDWDEHREEMRKIKREVNEEMKKAMEEVRKEIKEYKEKRKEQ
ncbi:MAG: hypothetical protein R3345_08065 [Fulvivirga sp.]|nr:hypothetical protein [Fulvivirga sp.]